MLYELDRGHLAELDRKEGNGWAYVRGPVAVQLDAVGPELDALAYRVIEPQTPQVEPSGDYLDALATAARARGLPGDYVESVLSTWRRPLDEPVRIVPYDRRWPERYELERNALAAAIGEWAVGGIHHVGSTSVPDLAAKPIIDILVGVLGLAQSRPCIERLAALGYRYAPYRHEQMHWLCKPSPQRRTHHLHLVPVDSPRFRDELGFRDRLRADPATARAYSALKRELAGRFEHDRDAYTQAKTQFIRAALGR